MEEINLFPNLPKNQIKIRAVHLESTYHPVSKRITTSLSIFKTPTGVQMINYGTNHDEAMANYLRLKEHLGEREE